MRSALSKPNNSPNWIQFYVKLAFFFPCKWSDACAMFVVCTAGQCKRTYDFKTNWFVGQKHVHLITSNRPCICGQWRHMVYIFMCHTRCLCSVYTWFMMTCTHCQCWLYTWSMMTHAHCQCWHVHMVYDDTYSSTLSMLTCTHGSWWHIHTVNVDCTHGSWWHIHTVNVDMYTWSMMTRTQAVTLPQTCRLSTDYISLSTNPSFTEQRS